MLLVGLTFAVPRASAVTLTVNTTAYELNIPAGASVSLHEALRDAAFVAGVDTIVFAQALFSWKRTNRRDTRHGSGGPAAAIPSAEDDLRHS